MKAELWRVGGVGFKIVQKHERLDQFANIAGADEPGHGAMRMSARSQNDRPDGVFDARLGRGHGMG